MFGQIVAYLKTFQTIVSLVEKLIEYWEERKLRKVESAAEDRNRAVEIINKKIKAEASKEQVNDEAIRDLHRRLNNISGKL